ncbi:unnamed protein product [Brassicogethes aeneus]|uniref:Chitin-binding type-4 domain-containing protein n=1 Tax=Brassicogethes aeneus TaxID=1431903 RepID=A0A9P0B1D9_BRAAE|nr:unnamed protein product [Brassicogethes aeneus]
MGGVSIWCSISVLVNLIYGIAGHGMMLEPPNRSSLWRFDKSAEPNYSDMGINCGGFGNQWKLHNGKCGVCGDAVQSPHPQENENGGKYGKGKIAKTYKPGSTIDVHIKITYNHIGHFTYSLCKLDNPNKPEAGEHCFKPLKLADGSASYKVKPEDKEVYNKVVLPNMTCKRCVLRWNWTVGNNWGTCKDGKGGKGCGPQEVFRNCADIAIV